MRISDWSSDVCSSDLTPSAPASISARVASPVATLPASTCTRFDSFLIFSTVTATILLWPCAVRSEGHTSELQSLMRITYAVFHLKTKTHIISLKTSITNTNTLPPYTTNTTTTRQP